MQIFVLQTFGGFWTSGSVGGGVLGVIGTAKEWESSGHEVQFVTNEGDQRSEQYTGYHAVHRVPSMGLFPSPSPVLILLEMMLNPFIQRKPIDELIRAHRRGPCIFLAISPFPSDVVTAFRLRHALRAPAAVYFHHSTPPPWWHPFRRGNLLRSTVSWAMGTASLALCKIGGLAPIFDQPEQLERVGWRFPEVIADAHFLPPQDRGEPLGTTPKYAACFVSRLAPNKGLPDLLSAWRLVRQQVPDAKLLIGGEWYSARFRQRILRLASRLKIQEVVTFAGFLTPTAKREVLEGSQIFVCPSYEEGWSIGVMEAAYHGLTPIVYDLPAYGYLGKDAIRVRPGDVTALATAVVQALRDPGGRARAAPRLRAAVQGYTAKALADEQAKSFQRLLEADHRPRAPPKD